ncbi:MAG: outer membrane lipoprotein carrier protein LolA [Rhodospirillales bacterium]
MFRLFAPLVVALAVALALIGPAQAYTLTATDKADIARIEKYLNAITTMRAKFVQSEQDGRTMEGVLSLQRPGRLRFSFVPKGPYEIIADGTRLNYIGGGALTQVSMDATPLGVLVAKEIRLDDTLEVVDVQRAPKFIALTLAQKKNPNAEKLTIEFADNPLQLKKWAITYKNGHVVTVGLFDVETGVIFPPDTFKYIGPGSTQQQTY